MGSQDQHRRPSLTEAVAAQLEKDRKAAEQAAQPKKQEGSADAA